MLGAIAGAIGGSLLGGAQQAYSSKLQYRTQKKIAQNSPSWNVSGLRKAGLNPILAANPAGGMPSAGLPAASNPDITSGSKNLSSAQLQRSQVGLTNASTGREISATAVNNALADKAKHEANTAKAVADMEKAKSKAYKKIPFLNYLDAINKAGAGLNLGDASRAAEVLRKATRIPGFRDLNLKPMP